MESALIRELTYGLKQYYSNADDANKIIMNAAMVAATADAIGGSIPVLAIPATIISCFGVIWVMYGKLCSTLGITLKQNVLKLLAKAALANITANLGGIMIAMFAGMFIPGASILASAAVAFITVYLAGIVFLRLILKLAKESRGLGDLTDREMKKAARDVKLTKEDLQNGKDLFDANKKQ